jgi:hypothetical protein
MDRIREMPDALREATINYYQTLLNHGDPLIGMSSVASFLTFYNLSLDPDCRFAFKKMVSKLLSVDGKFEDFEDFRSALAEVLGCLDERV